MSAISQKSISGITSITSPAGTDDQISLHTSNTNEALKIDGAGNLHLNNHVNTTGVTTASNFKTGSSNLHSAGVEVAGINVLGADTPIGAGSTIYNSGAAVFTGVVTATSFVGSGANLTGIGNSFKGLYISNGMIVHDNVLNGNHYIGTSMNGLMAGPVTIDGNLEIDGNYVVV